MGRKGPPMQEADQDSEADSEEESEEDAEEAPRRQWQGIEAIFEAYQEHIEGRGLRRWVIVRSGLSTLEAVCSLLLRVEGLFQVASKGCITEQCLVINAKTLIFLQGKPIV